MPVDHDILRKGQLRSPETFAQVEQIAAKFLAYLRSSIVEQDIAKVHRLGASSAMVQAIIQPGADSLGFSTEKKGLFTDYSVSALRPDYFMKVGDSGILLEVERGKTTTNNMDLLDLWKCHICLHADYLFLVVPNARVSEKGGVMRHFKQVQKRLGTFFVPRNYVNVEAVFLFGY